MKILALGATGAIGRELIEVLAPHQHEIHVTTRRPLPPRGNVTYIQGNAQEDAFLHQVLRENWDVIVDFMVYDTSTFRRRVDILLGSSGQYVFTSTARVFSDVRGLITERSPRLLDVSQDAAYMASDEYALTKARQEDLLRASALKNWTIIRPYITFGEGRLQLGTLEKEGWLYRALNGRSIVFCDELMDKWTTVTDGSDVARMIAVLLGRPDALGEDYNLAGPNPVKWSLVLDVYLETIEKYWGCRPDVVLQDLASFCRSAASLPQVIYDRVYDRRFDATKIGNLLDLNSLTDCFSALRSRLLAQLADARFLPIDWRAEAKRDKATGEHTALREVRGARSKLKYLYYRHVSH